MWSSCSYGKSTTRAISKRPKASKQTRMTRRRRRTGRTGLCREDTDGVWPTRSRRRHGVRRMLSAGDEKRWCGRCGEPETRSPVRAAVVAFSGDWTLAYMNCCYQSRWTWRVGSTRSGVRCACQEVRRKANCEYTIDSTTGKWCDELFLHRYR